MGGCRGCPTDRCLADRLRRGEHRDPGAGRRREPARARRACGAGAADRGWAPPRAAGPAPPEPTCSGCRKLQSVPALLPRVRQDVSRPVAVESVALKGRKLRGNRSLVLAMFAAELHDLLLTGRARSRRDAGRAHRRCGGWREQYTGLGGRDRALQPNDMYICDEAGVLSSILYGPDIGRRSCRPPDGPCSARMRGDLDGSRRWPSG